MIVLSEQKANNNLWHLTLQLNARLMPLDRGVLFEEPLDYMLKKLDIGEVDGGGTFQESSGELKSCDIEIYIHKKADANFNELYDFIMYIGVPKGSFLISKDSKKEIGNLEGMALYLNGTDLDDEIYKACDVNYVVSEIIEILGSEYKYYSYWQGSNETALYFYGQSFDKMRNLIIPFIETYPLCKKNRLVQIA